MQEMKCTCEVVGEDADGFTLATCDYCKEQRRKITPTAVDMFFDPDGDGDPMLD
jgi:hypothetical protein